MRGHERPLYLAVAQALQLDHGPSRLEVPLPSRLGRLRLLQVLLMLHRRQLDRDFMGKKARLRSKIITKARASRYCGQYAYI